MNSQEWKELDRLIEELRVCSFYRQKEAEKEMREGRKHLEKLNFNRGFFKGLDRAIAALAEFREERGPRWSPLPPPSGVSHLASKGAEKDAG